MSEVLTHYASLHMHSTHSDGVYSPEELARVGADEGFRALVLTDHDTVTGTDEMIAACKSRGLECMMGIEFSTWHRATGKKPHMTAYHFDPEYPELKEYLCRLSEKETHETYVLFNRATELGLIKDITWDEVLEYNEGITWLCNEHVFRAMKSKGLITDTEYPKFFEECFGKFRSMVPPLYDFMDPEELIPLVHRAGGIIFIAHPRAPYVDSELLDVLVNAGIDGVEVWHALLPIENRREILEFAKKHDLFVSGGADHEGLLGGQYERYEHPEETEFFFPPLTLGTTEYFWEEIRDNKKKPDRRRVMADMLADDSLWERAK